MTARDGEQQMNHGDGSEEEWDRSIAINLTGAFLSIRR
jgi:NAD(P)-dependent dehydrogenase (short-subunit alcohol dehydrogenase family)